MPFASSMRNLLTILLGSLASRHDTTITATLLTSWSVVPPSTNPSAILNINLLNVLGRLDGVNCRKVDAGRVWLDVENPVVLKKIDARSARIVVFQTSDCTDQNAWLTITKYISEKSWKNRLLSALSLWEEMGNHIGGGYSDTTFTISCQRWNDFVDPLQSTSNVANYMANTLTEMFGWKRVKKSKESTFDFNILLQGSGAILELITLVRPLAIEELPKPGFKRVESFILAKAADIRTNNVVLDPMCGRGTFLIEASTFWPDATYLGVDASIDQLRDATVNCQSARVCVQLIQGDATDLKHIYDNSVDRILCCPPFGRQFDKRSKSLYLDLMIEWSRVLTDNGRMVLLIDMENVESLIQAIVQARCSVSFQRSPFRLGRLQATILVVTKASGVELVDYPRFGTFEWEVGDLVGRAQWSYLRSEALPKLAPIRPVKDAL